MAVVCPHFEENLGWVIPLLDAFPKIAIYLYDCEVSPVADDISAHERVWVRKKPAKATHFCVYFDFCFQNYEQLPSSCSASPRSAGSLVFK